MSEIIKNIHGGIELDAGYDHINEDKLVDAINVTHNNDTRRTGVLHPSLGVDQANYVLRNRTKFTLAEALDAFSKIDYSSKLLSINNVGFYFKVDRGVGSHMFRIERNPDFDARADLMSISEEFNVTYLAFYPNIYYDDSWQGVAFEFMGTYTLYMTKLGERLTVITTGDNLVTTSAALKNEADPNIYPPIEIVGIVEMPSIIPPSVTRYSYRVGFVDGSYEAFAIPSATIVIPVSYPKNPDTDLEDTIDYTGAADKTKIKSNIGVRLKIDFDKAAGLIPNAKTIEIVAIRYFDGSGIPVVDNVGNENYTSEVFTTDGVSVVPSLAADLYSKTILNVGADNIEHSYRACAIKDQVLYLGNVGNIASLENSQHQNIKNAKWDPRVWQFNSKKQALAYNRDYTKVTKLEIEELKNLTTTNWKFFQNDGRDGEDSFKYFGTENYAMFCNDGITHGAEGENIILKFVVGGMDYGNVYVDKTGDPGIKFKADVDSSNAEYKFSPKFNKISPCSNTVGLNSSDILGKWFGENVVAEGIMPHVALPIFDNTSISSDYNAKIGIINFALDETSSGHSYDNPIFASKFAALQHDSVYRFGCVIVYSDDSQSDVLYMGDIRTPSMNTSQFQLFEDHVMAYNALHSTYKDFNDADFDVAQFVELRFFPLFLQVTFNNLQNLAPEPIKNIRLVYATRKFENRNVITTGALHAAHSPIDAGKTTGLTNNFWKDGQKSSIPPAPTLGRSRYYFGGVNCLCPTEFYNSRPAKAAEGKPTSMAAQDFIAHSFPDKLQFVIRAAFIVYRDKTGTLDWFGSKSKFKYGTKLVGKRVDVGSYLSSSVMINSTNTSSPGFLFYAPELDIIDVDKNPYIHGLKDLNNLNTNICTHYGLSSLIPAGRQLAQVSCAHSSFNEKFDNYINKNTIVEDRISYLGKGGFNYDMVYKCFDFLDSVTYTSSSWTKPKGCIMTTNITSIFTPKATGAPDYSVVEDSNCLKSLKYLCKWNTYSPVSGTKASTYSSLSVSACKYIKTTFQNFKEMFQFLFPCTFSAQHSAAYSSDKPYGMYCDSVGTLTFANMSPLWSGEYYIEGSSYSETVSDIDAMKFPKGYFINQMSSMGRNHGYSEGYCNLCVIKGYGQSTNWPGIRIDGEFFSATASFSNYDATITPLSEHGQRMSLKYTVNNFPVDNSDVKVDDTKNCTSLKITTPLSNTDWKTFVLKYPPHKLPNKQTLVFPDVVWDSFSKKAFIKEPSYYVEEASYVATTTASSHTTGRGHPMANGSLASKLNTYIISEEHFATAGEANEKFIDISSTYDYSCGLNYSGLGGNALLIQFKDASKAPGQQLGFNINSTKKDDSSGTFLDGVNFVGSKTVSGIQGPDKFDNMLDSLNLGSHVMLSTIRNKVIPYVNVLEEFTTWQEVHPDCKFTPSETDPKTTSPQFVYGFDTYVGVHKRMYLTPFYPDGFGVNGDGANSGSSPMRMMFPYEGPVNVDIANVTDDVDNINNPTPGSSFKRIGLPGIDRGITFNTQSGTYTPKRLSYSYNPCYSYKIPSYTLSTFQEDDVLQKVTELPERLIYTLFNYETGRFDAVDFSKLQYIDLDRRFGGINKIFPVGNDLFLFQERCTSVITPNARTLLESKGDERGIYLRPETLLGDGTRYVSLLYGSSPHTDIFAAPDAIYWVDIAHRAILKHSTSGLQNISNEAGFSTYMKHMLNNVGELASCHIYRLYDGNIRFRFGQSPYVAADDPFSMSKIDRRLIEYNNSLKVFTSFITLGNFDVINIGGDNVYINHGLIFDEGYYDAWGFFTSAEVPPAIEVYVNPGATLDDKRFISCSLLDNDDVCRDVIVGLRVEYDVSETPAIERALQVFHYRKIYDAEHTQSTPWTLEQICSDLPNITDFTSEISGISPMTLDKINKGEYLVINIVKNSRRFYLDKTRGIMVLGRAAPFGRKINIAFDTIDPREIPEIERRMDYQIGGGGIVTKGVLLKVHFQSFNVWSTDEIGRTPEKNAPTSFGGRYEDIQRRARYYFNPIKINYEPDV